MEDYWNHYGYHIRPDNFQKCLAWIQSSPNLQHANYDCPAHQILNKRDTTGCWIGLDAFNLYEPFLFKKRENL